MVIIKGSVRKNMLGHYLIPSVVTWGSLLYGRKPTIVSFDTSFVKLLYVVVIRELEYLLGDWSIY